jgi:hypothetical protein
MPPHPVRLDGIPLSRLPAVGGLNPIARPGSDEIPALLLEDGSAISGDTDEIIANLDERYSERADAQQHRDAAAEHDQT